MAKLNKYEKQKANDLVRLKARIEIAKRGKSPAQTEPPRWLKTKIQIGRD
jgi:hypothetical protein